MSKESIHWVYDQRDVLVQFSQKQNVSIITKGQARGPLNFAFWFPNLQPRVRHLL